MMDQIWRFWVGSKSKVEPLVYLVSNHFSLIGESHVKIIPQTIFKQLRFKLCWLFEIFIWKINKLKIVENIWANRFRKTKQKSWKSFVILYNIISGGALFWVTPNDLEITMFETPWSITSFKPPRCRDFKF